MGFKSKSYEIFQKLFTNAILFIFGIKVKVTGLEHISANNNYIVVANHVSWFDQFVIVHALPMHLHFMVKEEYMRIPILSRAFKLYGFVSVNRKNPDSSISSQVRSILEKGNSIVIYPEGKRSTGGQILPFKSGAFRYSTNYTKAILPIFIQGTSDLLLKTKSLLHFKTGTVILKILPTRDVSEETEIEKAKLETLFRSQLAKVTLPKSTELSN